MTDHDNGTDDSTERQQTLDTAMSRSRRKKLEGRLDQRLTDAFHLLEDEVEQSSDRFYTAIAEGWEMHYAVATSGAHGWQIEADDGLRLAEDAYPGDVSWLVFENGWIHKTGARWLKDDELAEWVADVQDRRQNASERIMDAETEAFEADDRLQYHNPYGEREMEGWWIFEPTGYVGRPEAAVAHAAGYDAHDEDSER
jgi:hypothetical protein